jgi:hypothetical protein
MGGAAGNGVVCTGYGLAAAPQVEESHQVYNCGEAYE